MVSNSLPDVFTIPHRTIYGATMKGAKVNISLADPLDVPLGDVLLESSRTPKIESLKWSPCVLKPSGSKVTIQNVHRQRSLQGASRQPPLPVRTVPDGC